MKKSFIILLATFMPLTIMAYDAYIDGIYYNVLKKAKTASVTNNGNWVDGCYSGDIVIPETIEYEGTTCSVISIEDYAFENSKDLHSVFIPNSVTEIGSSVFYRCASMTNINIPNGVTEIRGYTFSGCSSLKNIKLSEGIKSIGEQAFSNCSSLISIDIPNGVTEIRNSTFKGCTSLKDIKLSEGIKNIGEQAFSDCSSLTGINLPEYMTNIGKQAFSSCSSLTSIKLPEGITNIEEKTFFSCTSLESIDIPNSLMYIGEWAFRNCSSLTSIKLPVGITNIENLAFSGCTSLKSIDFPNGVSSSIGENTFSGCYSLKSIDIPNSVTSIGKYAFSGCKNLATVTIGNGITTINEYTFNNCSSLKSVNMGNKVRGIEKGAFYDCKSLKDIKLSEGMWWIREEAFLGCYSLESIDIPDSVSSIGKWAFDGCNNLTTVTIGKMVTSLRGDVFTNCNRLTSVSIDSDFINKNGFSYYFGNQVKECILGNNVTSIGNSVFMDYYSLTSVIIGNGVTAIGEKAFYGCSNLSSATFGNSVKSIGVEAFHGCSSLRSIVTPDTMEMIGNAAFEGCSKLESISLGRGMNKIGRRAFANCKELSDVTNKSFGIPTTNKDAFDSSFIEYATLYVPEFFIPIYSNEVPWKDFGEIKPITPKSDKVLTGDWYHFQDEYDHLPEDLTGVVSLISGYYKNSIIDPAYTEADGTVPDGCTVGALIGNLFGGVKWTFTEGVNSLLINMRVHTECAFNIEYTLSDGSSHKVETQSIKANTYCHWDVLSNAGIPATIRSEIRNITLININDYTGMSIYDMLIVVPYKYTEISANNFKRYYGDENPEFKYTVDGTDIGGVPEIQCEATKESPVGTYPIIISQGSVTNKYVNYVNGTLTIEKAPLDAYVGNYEITIGEDIAFDLWFEGFKNGEDENVLGVIPFVSCDYQPYMGSGSYPIYVWGGEATNYEIICHDGILTVKGRDEVSKRVEVKIHNASRYYGEENPEFTYTIIEGEEFESNFVIYCHAAPEDPVGNYWIEFVLEGVDPEQFSLDITEGILTILPAPLTVTAEDCIRAQYEENPAFTLRYDGFKNGETEEVLTKKPVATTSATFDSAPGEYEITVSGGEAWNYSLQYQNGTLTITPPSGIETVQFDHPVDVYNLQGTRVRQQVTRLSGLPRGVYIVDGKKAVVK